MMHISDTCVNRTPLPTFNTKDANSYDASIEKSSLGLSPSLILCTRLIKQKSYQAYDLNYKFILKYILYNILS